MTETATSRTVTIEAAAVTIRVVHVADKPMTIAVYEQLPIGNGMDENDVPIGWVNRCPKTCRRPGSERHWHVLAVRDGEPVLVASHRPTSWDQETRVRTNAIADAMRKLTEAEDWSVKDKQRTQADLARYEHRSAEDKQWMAKAAATSAARTADELTKASEQVDKARDWAAGWAAWLQRWAPVLTDLPQLYIAR